MNLLNGLKRSDEANSVGRRSGVAVGEAVTRQGRWAALMLVCAIPRMVVTTPKGDCGTSMHSGGSAVSERPVALRTGLAAGLPFAEGDRVRSCRAAIRRLPATKSHAPNPVRSSPQPTPETPCSGHGRLWAGRYASAMGMPWGARPGHVEVLPLKSHHSPEGSADTMRQKVGHHSPTTHGTGGTAARGTNLGRRRKSWYTCSLWCRTG